ncbi:MAG: NADH-quinone oxidoreductase subunit NuoG [Gammaproteobacteria bacterium]|nr:NADH-quinone oxidoreductase subunit NuoG [Gammaproteobacteria bacterium]
MATVIIDGIEYEAEEGANLLHAVLSQRLDLPYFCWHPSLGSVGACRQCAVIQYMGPEDERGRLQMACMTNVSDGMRVSIDAPFATEFRSTVIEWLMENHPHDCPVCEEGGECHLQDMTVMTGHSVRRYRGQKRTWRNQDLGPFIGHEMNRCITCYRCVRFYDDYAGGKDLGAFGSRDRMFFGRFEDGTLESEFAGNLVEVCPTGVFTDKPFASQYTRKWDLQSAPSVCPGCSVGCNIFVSERYGQLRRVTNRYHGQLNQYFICDRGRFGSHFVNSDKRVRNAGVRREDGAFEYGDSKMIVEEAAKSLSNSTIGIGSPRASLESNFALRELVGSENFCVGIEEKELEVLSAYTGLMREGGFSVPSLEEVEESDAILILGEDISNTAPRVALSVRQASRIVSFDLASGAEIPVWQDAGVRGHAQHSRNPLFVATPASTRLDDIATQFAGGSVDELIGIANSVQRVLDNEEEDSGFAVAVGEALKAAKHPLVITGCSLQNEALVRLAGRIAQTLNRNGQDSRLIVVPSEANSLGVALLGGGLSLTRALDRMSSGEAAILLENDLYRRASSEVVDKALENGECIALDSNENATLSKSRFVFAAATYAEQTGTFVNYESRAQRFFQAFEPDGEVLPSWRWLSQFASLNGRDELSWKSFEGVSSACANSTFEELNNVAPSADFRLKGGSKIPRQTHRYSGRTAMRAHLDIHEPKSTVDVDTPFTYSMEGQNPADQDGAAIPYAWAPGWNSNQSVFKFQQEVGGELIGGDPGIRLIAVTSEPVPSSAPDRKLDVTTSEETTNGNFEVVPLNDVFGSDEMSSLSWPIQRRMSAPYLVISHEDARRLDLKAGMGVHVSGLDESLEVRIDSRLKAGLAGVPRGMIKNGESLASSIELSLDPDFVSRASVDRDVIARG